MPYKYNVKEVNENKIIFNKFASWCVVYMSTQCMYFVEVNQHTENSNGKTFS